MTTAEWIADLAQRLQQSTTEAAERYRELGLIDAEVADLRRRQQAIVKRCRTGTDTDSDVLEDAVTGRKIRRLEEDLAALRVKETRISAKLRTMRKQVAEARQCHCEEQDIRQTEALAQRPRARPSTLC